MKAHKNSNAVRDDELKAFDSTVIDGRVFSTLRSDVREYEREIKHVNCSWRRRVTQSFDVI